MNISWGTIDNYECWKKLGRGKYSEVFLGLCKSNNSKCVIKVLKPVKSEKIYREIKILQAVYGGPNIVKLTDLIKEGVSRIPCFVYEWMECQDSKNLFTRLTDFECRIYVFKILQALEFSHSHGIMHRDLKPLNIVVDNKNKDLRVIDWGLAEFYIKDKDYNVRVASRYYKGPELLVDDRYYHYSLDIWSLGCTMAGMIYRIETFFKGSDNFDQLIKIMKVLGDEELHEYIHRYNLKIPKETKKLMKGIDFEKKPWASFINEKNKDLCCPEAIDLMSKMLVYDKNMRINCKDSMAHPYFDPIREFIKKQDE
jgi:casein kinase II subunit alpha